MCVNVLSQQLSCHAACLLQLMKSISDKHEEVMARMGSIMAAGILDAGKHWPAGEGAGYWCTEQPVTVLAVIVCEA